MTHRGKKPLWRHAIDIHIFVLVRHAWYSAVTCSFTLDSVQDHACDYDKENGAKCRTECDKDGDAVGMTEAAFTTLACHLQPECQKLTWIHRMVCVLREQCANAAGLACRIHTQQEGCNSCSVEQRC